MKIKFISTLLLVIICLMIFLATSFTHPLFNAKLIDFLRGFSMGMGVVALIATVYYYSGFKIEKKLSNEQ